MTVKVLDYKTLDEVHLDLVPDENAELVSGLDAVKILAIAEGEFRNGYTTTKSLVVTLNAFATHGFEVLSTATSGETLIYTLAKAL